MRVHRLRWPFALLVLVLCLPIGQASAEHDIGPARVYFPETGHTLQGAFLDYWRHHGDVTLLGYPISEEFVNPANDVITQYFERAVFEWHPDYPDDWQVLLYRLGAEAIEGRENQPRYRPSPAMQTSDCSFFPETDHNVCFGFRDYWQQYGGLPVFGYPLSEELEEDGRVVQYFERARFEWHPENAGTIYEVLFGRLGAERAEQGKIDTARVSQPEGVPTYAPDLWHAPGPLPDSNAFMDDLAIELSGMVAGWAGDNAVTVTDLQTGYTISTNGDRQQQAACTMKVFMMMGVAQDIEAGKYRHEDIADLVESAMGPSNTYPARELIALTGDGSIAAGIARINGFMQALGMTDSIVTHPPGYPGDDYGYGLGDNVVTTNDLNRALAKLWHGEAGLSKSATDYVLWSMTLSIEGQSYSLGGGIPSSVTLYHKIGLLYEPWSTWNDFGIFVFEREGQQVAYAISYLGANYGLGHDDWKDAYYHGSEISAAAWQAFDNAYR